MIWNITDRKCFRMELRQNFQIGIDNQLRVRWTTPLGCSMKRFYVPVKNIQDGLKIIDLLSEYDTFRLKKIVKPDYNYIGVFELYVYGKWIPVYINEDGYDYKISFTHRGNSSVVQILENFGRQLYGQIAFKQMDEWMEKYGYKYQ